MNSQPIPATQLEQLRELHGRLLRLHKILLDLQRVEFEKVHGPVQSTGEFLNLVLENESFEWLRQLSGLIVQIDEVRSPRREMSAADATSVMEEVHRLLVPKQDGTLFQQKYGKALQRSSEAEGLHREVTGIE